MGMRKIASVCLWMMIMAGIGLLALIFVVPRFAEAVANMSDGRTPLPVGLRLVFFWSQVSVHYSWLFGFVYLVLFAAVIYWYCMTKPKTTME